MKKCGNCGKEYNNKAKKCHSCNLYFTQKEASRTYNMTKKNYNRLIKRPKGKTSITYFQILRKLMMDKVVKDTDLTNCQSGSKSKEGLKMKIRRLRGHGFDIVYFSCKSFLIFYDLHNIMVCPLCNHNLVVFYNFHVDIGNELHRSYLYLCV